MVQPAAPEHLAISKQIKRLVWLVVALYLIQAGVGVFFYLNSRDQREKLAVVAISTAKGLCAVRHDAEKSVQQSQEFLKENPKGIPGISPSLLRRSIRQQTELKENLQGVVCPPPTPKPTTTVGGPSAK